jgi:TolB protein
VILAVVLAGAGACNIGAPRPEGPSGIPAKAAFPQWDPSDARIAFNSDRDGSNEIYVMSSEGADVTRLTTDPDSDDFSPIWSPDGTQIIFRSLREETNNISIMNADGSA